MPRGDRRCHRDLVAALLIAYARRKGETLTIVEWPGGVPREIQDDFSPMIASTIAKVALSKTLSVPLPAPLRGPNAVALPWGSYAMLPYGDARLAVPFGPAFYSQGRWSLPLFLNLDGHETVVAVRREILAVRKYYGLDQRSTGTSANKTDRVWQKMHVGRCT